MPQRPEQVLVLRRVGRHILPVGGHHVRRHEVVGRQTVLADQPALASSTEGQPGYPRRRDQAARRGQPKGLGLPVELTPRHPVLDLACGVCNGPIKVARTYPDSPCTVVDGDAYTLQLARQNLEREGLAHRFQLIHSPLEELAIRDACDVAIINISLHEARDIERVVANARRALCDGGTFLVSEFPFPETIEGCRTLPAQIMCGIQFFEAHIGCQLLPTSRFVELLTKAGFRDVGAIDVTPVHVVVHGTK